jgi:hypothetical protein
LLVVTARPRSGGGGDGLRTQQRLVAYRAAPLIYVTAPGNKTPLGSLRAAFHLGGEVSSAARNRDLHSTAGSDFSDDRSSARRSSKRIASLRLGIFGCDRRQSSTSAKIGPFSGNRTTAARSCMKAPRVQCYEVHAPNAV